MVAEKLRVTMFVGGGISHTAGGVGTLIRYLQEEWSRQSNGPILRVVDTRGQGGKPQMGLRFTQALCFVVFLFITRRLGLMHIHMNAYGSTLRKGILVVLGRMLRSPVIVHMHGADFREFYFQLPSLGQRGVRFILNLAQSIIVIGTSWREFLVSEVGVSSSKIAVILNGVPSPARAGKGNQTRPGPLRILFLGRLGERKGVPELLQALHTPVLLSRSWIATIAGDGPIEQTRAIVAAVGMTDRVRVPGWVNRDVTAELLASADIFVLPSHHEVMPVALLEALAYGVAIVTTPVGAIPEILADKQTALFVPPGNVGELASAILRLIDDASERCRLAEAGRQLFHDELDIGVVTQRIDELYDSVMLHHR